MADGKITPKDSIYTFQQNTRVYPEHVETWMEKINYIRFYFFKKKISFGGLSHIDREQVEYNNNMYTTLLSFSLL